MDKVDRILFDQDELASSVEAIESYQAQLDEDLTALSEAVDREVENSQSMEPIEDDFNREQTYTLAADLDQHLTLV